VERVADGWVERGCTQQLQYDNCHRNGSVWRNRERNTLQRLHERQYPTTQRHLLLIKDWGAKDTATNKKGKKIRFIDLIPKYKT
jgi:hypothetical protein